MDKVSISTRGPTKASGAGKALVKGLALIDAVSGADGPVRVGALVKASGLPRPTALRLLDVLVEERALQPAGDGAYALGPRLAAWGQRYLDGLDVRANAEDLMARAGRRDPRDLLPGHPRGPHRALRRQGRLAAAGEARRPDRDAQPAAQHRHRQGAARLRARPTTCAAYSEGEMVAKTPEHDHRRRTGSRPRRRRSAPAATRSTTWRTRTASAAWRGRSATTPATVVAALSVSAPAYRFALEDLPALAPRVLAAAAEISSRIGYRQGGGDG